MPARSELDKAEIKTQIDAIIHLMEEQIEAAKAKQTMIDQLIKTSEKASEQLTKMKDAATQPTPAKSSSHLLLLLAGLVSLGSLGLLVSALR